MSEELNHFDTKTQTEFDCDFQNWPVCPYCGDKSPIEGCDASEEAWQDDSEWQRTCGECDKDYAVTTNVTYAYDTRKLPCANGEPHRFEEWVKRGDFESSFCEYCGTSIRRAIQEAKP
jgi:hypothetical protein